MPGGVMSACQVAWVTAGLIALTLLSPNSTFTPVE